MVRTPSDGVRSHAATAIASAPASIRPDAPHAALLGVAPSQEGGFPYKKAIVDTILVIIAKVPEAKEAGLGHLCEFIEDCEFTLLSTQILYLLGLEGPGTQDPSKYIRFIYNRVVLENATVRASAVSALAKFGLQLDYLRDSIVVLLQRCLHDDDDEVRDRATFFVAMLQSLARGEGGIGGLDPKKMLLPLAVPLDALEASAKAYLQNPSDEAFSIANVTVDPEMVSSHTPNPSHPSPQSEPPPRSPPYAPPPRRLTLRVRVRARAAQKVAQGGGGERGGRYDPRWRRSLQRARLCLQAGGGSQVFRCGGRSPLQAAAVCARGRALCVVEEGGPLGDGHRVRGLVH
jgi:hypothetical protein